MPRTKIGDLSKRVEEALAEEELGIKASKGSLLGEIATYIENQKAALESGTAHPRIRTERAISRAEGLAERLMGSNEGCLSRLERLF